jgi:DNA-binding MarR family transcriptional regulator
MEMYTVFASIFLIAQKWQRIADQQIYPKINISLKQWLLIVIIQYRFPDYPPTLSEAAAEYGSSRQNLKQIALALQKQKMLLITTDPDDRRIQRLALTGKHRQYFEGEENQKWQTDFVSGFFAGIDAQDIRHLHRIIGLVMDRIRDIETSAGITK